MNLRGLKQMGKREEIEAWMIKEKVDLLFAQETHVPQNRKEKRKEFTWYLNGSKEGERESAGMAVIVRNEIFLKCSHM